MAVDSGNRPNTCVRLASAARLAMQIDSEPTDIGLEGGKGLVAERTADRHTGLAACSEEHRAVRIAGQLGGSRRAHVARTHLR